MWLAILKEQLALGHPSSTPSTPSNLLDTVVGVPVAPVVSEKSAYAPSAYVPSANGPFPNGLYANTAANGNGCNDPVAAAKRLLYMMYVSVLPYPILLPPYPTPTLSYPTLSYA